MDEHDDDEDDWNGGGGRQVGGGCDTIQTLISLYRFVWLIVTRRVRHLSGLLIDCDFQGIQRRCKLQPQYSLQCTCGHPQAAHVYA